MRNNRFSLLVDDEEPEVAPEKETPPPPSVGGLSKYRCEQTVVTKINGVVSNHAETKWEFHMTRRQSGGDLYVDVVMADNIINFNPPQLQEAIQLLGEVDQVKSNAKVLVDGATGKIARVINHKEIIENWNRYKNELTDRYAFIRDKEARKNVQHFISLAEAQIVDERQLIADMGTKMFFDLFFDKYLVRQEGLFDPYVRVFYSQLFDGQPVPVRMEQLITAETPDTATVNKVGRMIAAKVDLPAMAKMYDQKYKPVIQYKFSEFDLSYKERYVLNTRDRLIETAEVHLMEEVRNNVQVYIHYTLKRIE